MAHTVQGFDVSPYRGGGRMAEDPDVRELNQVFLSENGTGISFILYPMRSA